MKLSFSRVATAMALVIPCLSSSLLAADAKKVVVYSSRQEHLIKPLFDKYKAETGVVVEYITNEEGPLLQRLAAEGPKTKADVFMTVDAGNLWKATQEKVGGDVGILQSISSKVLDRNIPKHLRDPNGLWYAMSVRARTIVYNPSKELTKTLSSYEDLADPRWKGRLCLRTSKKVYNQSLVAMLIEAHGEAEAEKIVRGWVANLATEVFPNDTLVIKAVAEGQCDVGIVNTYYFGREEKENPNIKAKLFWPNQALSKNHGVHVNVSGAGVVKWSKNKEEATKLLEWLSQGEAQSMFARENLEYPANPSVEPAALVKAWGKFDHNVINVAKAGELQAQAVKLMDRAGYK